MTSLTDLKNDLNDVRVVAEERIKNIEIALEGTIHPQSRQLLKMRLEGWQNVASHCREAERHLPDMTISWEKDGESFML